MEMNFSDFLRWEAATRDTLDVKLCYVDVAGDLVAGIVLSEIVYWYLPSKKDNSSKLRIFKDGEYWIASSREEWWERARIKPDRLDRALNILIEKGLIEKRIFRFNKHGTTHVRIIEDVFLKTLVEVLSSIGEKPNCCKTRTNASIGEKPISSIGEKPILLTEITTKITSLSEILKENEKDVEVPESCTEVDSSTPNSGEAIEDWFAKRGALPPEVLARIEQRKPQSKTAPRTPDDIRELTRQSLEKFQERTNGEDRELIDFLASIPEGLTDLARAFCKGFRRVPLKSEKGWWIKDWKIQNELGLLPTHIQWAFEKANVDGLTIKSPGSLTALAEKAKRDQIPGNTYISGIPLNNSNYHISDAARKLLENQTR